MLSSLGQLLFGTAAFLAGELFRIRHQQKSYTFEVGTSAQYQLFQKSFILEKVNFSEKQYSALPAFLEAAFLERLLFQKILPSIAATFSQKLFFHNILFLKSYCFISTLPFHRYIPIYLLVIKSTQNQLRKVKVWEFFLEYLLFLKVAS